MAAQRQRLNDAIFTKPDFPKPNVLFRSLDPILGNGALLSILTDLLADHAKHFDFNKIAALDSRGYFYAALLAERLSSTGQLKDVGIVRIVKDNSKIPIPCYKVSFDLEYKQGESLYLATNAINDKDKVLIVDDILITGGSVMAAANLIVQAQATAAGALVVGRVLETSAHLPWVHSVLTWETADSTELCTFSESNPSAALTYLPCILRPEIHLFYPPAMTTMAQSMSRFLPGCFQHANVVWSRFKDGTDDIVFPGNLAGKRLMFLLDLSKQDWIHRQLMLLRVLPKQGTGPLSLDVVIPYFAYGTNERISKPGFLATAEPMAKMISNAIASAPVTQVRLHVVDLHAPSPNRFSFDETRAQVVEHSFIGTVLDELTLRYGTGRFTLVFPDKGAKDRALGLLKHLTNNNPPPYIECAKVRSGDLRQVLVANSNGLTQQSLRVLVIVDDLIQTGGTAKECALAIASHVKSMPGSPSDDPILILAVTHGVFPQQSYHQFTHGPFDTIYLSDSVPFTANAVASMAPFQVLPLARSVIPSILNTYAFNSNVHLPVVLASTSPVKEEALRRGLLARFPTWQNQHIRCLAVPSGVPSQPLGIQQITEGATNRLTAATELIGDTLQNGLIVSMENGVLTLLGTMNCPADIGVVRMLYRQAGAQDVIVEASTDCVDIPAQVWELWQEQVKQVPDLTCGQVYASVYGLDCSNNWSMHARPFETRQYLLSKAVEQCLCALFS